MSLISKRYRFALISKDTYDALTEDEREQVVGDLWKKAQERLDRRIEEEERHGQYLEHLLEEWLSSVESARDTKTVDHYRLDLERFPFHGHLACLLTTFSMITSALLNTQ